jgi:hypothetical protein
MLTFVFISRPSTLLSCNRVSLFFFKTLKPKKRVGLVVRHTFNRAKFADMNVPRQCPFVLLLKVGWKGGKKFGS